MATESTKTMKKQMLARRIKYILIIFIAGLTLSGVTAFPIQTALTIAGELIIRNQWNGALTDWIRLAAMGVTETNSKFPFISYGTDWLAFAHIMFAIAFIGPLRDPVKNVWLIEF